MSGVEILCPPSLGENTTRVMHALAGGGIECDLVVDRLPDLPPGLAVGVLEPGNAAVFFHLGCRKTQGVPILLVGGQGVDLPAGLQESYHVSPSSRGFDERLLRQVRRLLGVRTPPPKTSGNLREFAKWLSHDWERLNQLDSQSFEKLIAGVLKESGHEVSLEAHENVGDMFVRYPKHHLTYLVECRANPKGEPFGLSSIREAHSLCAANQQQFGFLVINTCFTRAAQDWAARCVPALHLIDSETLKQTLKERVLEPLSSPEGTEDKVVFLSLPSGRKRRLRTFHASTASLDRALSPSASPRSDYDLVHFLGHGVEEKPAGIKCCFVCAGRRDEERDRSVSSLRERLREAGAAIEFLDRDTEPDLCRWSRTLNESALVFLHLGESTPRQSKIDQALQVVALAWRPPTERRQEFFVIAPDTFPARLSLPACLRESTFLDFSQEDTDKAFEKVLEAVRGLSDWGRWKEPNMPDARDG